jgi:CHASE2 domain-containing sensor protein
VFHHLAHRWVAHVVVVGVAIALALLLGSSARIKVEIAASTLLAGAILVGGALRLARHGFVSTMPYLAFLAGVLSIVLARALSDDRSATLLAVIGGAFCLTACALFVKELRQPRS